RLSCGWKPLRPGGSAIGIVKLPVPVKRSGENFSPMPWSAPPPLGREMISLGAVEFEPIMSLPTSCLISWVKTRGHGDMGVKQTSDGTVRFCGQRLLKDLSQAEQERSFGP